MKKTILLIFILSSVIGHSQCKPYDHKKVSDIYATVSYGGARTLSLDLALRVKQFNFGLGYGVMADNRINEDNGSIQYTRNDNAIYGIGSYRFGNLVLGVKGGLQHIIHVTEVDQELGDPREGKIGIYGGVCLSERTRFNLGYDTFEKLNIGVTFGL